MNTRLHAVAIAAMCAAPAFASTSFGDHVSLSGFGTLGAVVSDNKADAFVRGSAAEGANRTPSWMVDSKLGVQLDAKATDWLSGTLQVLATQRYEGNVNADFEWAFAKLTPVDGLTVRLGRITPAIFMFSDSRNIGYANMPIRMPNEAYSLAYLERLTGGDASYRFKAGGTTLTVSGLYGKSRVEDANESYAAESARGFNIVWDTDYGAIRLGQVRTSVLVPGIPVSGITTRAPYQFSGIGYQYDDGEALLTAEWVRRESKGFSSSVDTTGWYVLGGWRFGKFLPYAGYAKATRPDPTVPGIAGEQDAWTLGLRWDLITDAALKVQFDRVDPKGTAGISFRPVPFNPTQPLKVRDRTNVLSVAIDFVF